MDDVRVHITTYGCQMNRLDAELLAHALRHEGARVVDEPDEANVLLFLTCSVRAHAEERLFSNVGALKARKRRRPDLVVGILGCTAQQFGERIRERAPLADVVCGPGRLAEVPDLIRAARAGERPVVALDPPRAGQGDSAVAAGRASGPAEANRGQGAVAQEGPRAAKAASSPRRVSRALAHDGADAFTASDARLDDLELDRPLGGPSPRQACVTVMRGCDNFCAYCVVPHVRGPERSRRPSAVLDEVRRLVGEGARQITFLGQAVNKYQAEEAGRRWDLADLLAAAAETPGLDRLHFITNHPAAMTDRLADVFRSVPAVCPYLHMPAQAGSDAVLGRMNRGYTAAAYEAKVAMARDARPDVAVASDFIVGFPGETEADFEATCGLVRRLGFAGGFVFKYSPRPGTFAAERYPDDVPDADKRRRHQVLLDLVQERAAEQHRALVGRTVPVFIEGPSPKPHLDAAEEEGDTRPESGKVQLRGRTPGGRIVVFDGPADAAGDIVDVRLTRAAHVTLFGERVT
jgi:tRNA-2-methylthio-N6-dimethylallyladenosine synthase